ncbi:helix-turn-helix domain-containing protein (plasmid) [Halorussus salilacus]|uniref:ArsR/SmtB family transcription factor n=1 Tax=Halorussus salilacus TaxID=2953750 RepID=UPI00209F842B|nr:helix-turn-helix domain-containing protein [Halorussus salilacus]USZ69698.1 helix-turn-helix domain-containing protein [Halorussus salilacus]
MADLLPSSPDPSAGDGGDPRVIGVDSDDAADLLAALQSETARDILGALYDDPATPSALAEAADTSIQNVRYHLEKLTDADLVEVVDTVYSEKGREMNVYAPSAKPLVVFAGNDDDTEGVETALSRLLGGLGILGASSLLVQHLFDPGASGFEFASQGGDSGAGSDAGPNASDDAETATEEQGTATESGDTEVATEEPETVTEVTEEETEAMTTVAEETTEVATTVVDGGGTDALATLPPGLVFFLGGAVVLLALGVAWYVRSRSR